MEKRKRIYRKTLIGIAVINVILIAVCQIVLYRRAIPEQLELHEGEVSRFDFHMPASATMYEGDGESINEGEQVAETMAGGKTVSPVASFNLAKPFSISAGGKQEYTMEVKLFGLISLKQVSVRTVSEQYIIPGGQTVGIYVETDGVLVLGTTGVEDSDGRYVKPAENIIVKGDYITAVDGRSIHYKSQLLNQIAKHKENPMVLTVRRNKQKIKVKVTPVATKNKGDYKCGIWIRDDTQGIGTLTYGTEEGYFGALGHGVSDMDTGELMESVEGSIYKAQVSYVIAGKSGKPGELVGSIDYASKNQLGRITDNTIHGIYGRGNAKFASYCGDKAVPVALKQEVKEGKAVIQSGISGTLEKYEVEIEKVQLSGVGKANMIVRVTDDELLSLTGGIVQGMSGSPILQNGKIVGAVTHVFVNDPTRGYGIFIENMLEHSN